MFSLFKQKSWQDRINWEDFDLKESGDRAYHKFFVKGAHFHNGWKKLKPGDQVKVIHDYTNPHDGSAVGFYTMKNRLIGYMERDVDHGYDGFYIREEIIKAWNPIAVCVACYPKPDSQYINIHIMVFIAGYTKKEIIKKCDDKIQELQP